MELLRLMFMAVCVVAAVAMFVALAFIIARVTLLMMRGKSPRLERFFLWFGNVVGLIFMVVFAARAFQAWRAEGWAAWSGAFWLLVFFALGVVSCVLGVRAMVRARAVSHGG